MSTKTQETMGTLPVKEHEWLKNLVGEWKLETEMTMPNGEKRHVKGTQRVKMVGSLWAYGEGKGAMPDGHGMTYYLGLGYDVSYKEYRGFIIRSVSSHLWAYRGTLSADDKVMTLECEGPSMIKEGESVNYRDTIEIVDEDHRVYTSMGQDEHGQWQIYMVSRYSRV